MKDPYEAFTTYESQPITEHPLIDKIDNATLIAWFRCNSCLTCKWREQVIDNDINRDIHWCARMHDRTHIVDMVRYLGYSKE